MVKFSISFFCYYGDQHHTVHVQELDLRDVPAWIASYAFTHPACTAISFKVWFSDGIPDLHLVCG